MASTASKEQTFSFSASNTLDRYHIFLDSEDFNEEFHLFSVENDFEDSFILGPAIYNHFSILKCLLIYFPRHQFEVLPVHESSILAYQWHSRPPCLRAFSDFESDFYQWYLRLLPSKGLLWDTLSIHDALRFSCFEYHVNRELIRALSCFWSTSTNCFFFLFSPMSVTLLYVYCVTGLSPLGTDPSTLSLDTHSILGKLSDSELTYGAFIKSTSRRRA